MKCSKCGSPVTRDKGFEIGGSWFCAGCFVAKAQEARHFSKDDVARLKRAHLEETAGPIPRTFLLQILESGYDRISRGEEPFDQILQDMTNEIERAAGLFISREILQVIEACQHVFLEQEEEIRQRMRKLSGL